MSTPANAVTVRQEAPSSLALVEHRDSLVRKYASTERHSIALDPGPIHRLGLSLDGGTLAGAAGNTLCIWDTRTRNCTHRLMFKEPVEHIAVSGDGQRVLVADRDNALHQIDHIDGSRSELTVAPEIITAIAVDPDYTLCAYGTADGFVRTLDIDGTEPGLKIDTGAIPTGIVVDTTRDVLLITQRGSAEVYSLSSGDLIATYDGNESQIPDIELPWTQIVTTQGSVVAAFDAKTGKIVGSAECASAAIDSTLDGSRIVAAINHRTIIWDGRSEELLLDIHTYNRAVRDVKISNDGEHVYTCGHDSTVEVHTAAGRWQASLADSYGSLTGAGLTEGDKQLVVSDEQGLVTVYDVETGKATRYVQHDSSIAKLRVSGTWAATSAYDGTAAVLDVESGETIRRVGDGQVEIQAVALDGRECLLTGNIHGAVRCYDIATGKLIREYFGNEDAVRSVCVSPCRRYLLTTSERGLVVLFDYATGELLHELMEFCIVYDACFDADGEFFFFGDGFGCIKRVSTATGMIVDRWRVIDSDIRSITFFNDRICSVGLFDDAVMVDPKTGEVQLRAPVDTTLCHRIAFSSSSGERFIAGAQDGRLRFFDPATGALTAELHHITSGHLWTTAATGETLQDQWFWTDRPEIVNVYSAVDGQETLLGPEDPLRTEYVRTHNSRATTMARVGLSARAAKRDVAQLAQTHRAAIEEARQTELLEHLAS